VSTPPLSVVIPSYDTARMTLRCCQAVLRSLPEGAEVIVADDGSGDGTAEILAGEVPQVRVVRHENNRGFAAAANQGIDAANGRIILLLNSDTVVEASALHAILSSFDSDPQLGIAGAQLLNHDGTPQWSGGRTPTLPWMIGVVSGAGHLSRFFRRARRTDARKEIDWVSGAALAFRREVWIDAGPLSERFLF
jgi:GT2 family glycosyltransferase